MIKENTRRRFIALVPAVALLLGPIYAQQPLNPPLKNWAAPLYWAPSAPEAEQQRIEQRIVQRDNYSSAHAAGIFTAPGPMTFIAITPCRVMDTRQGQGFNGSFGPPSLAANVTRQVPMPTSTTCSIPANAGAYSLNFTVVPPGPLSFLSVWPAGQPYPGVSTLNDPVSGGFIANAAIVVAGTSGAIQMFASNPTDVIIDINGYYSTPTDGNGNTAIGVGTLTNNTTGGQNTAEGSNALFSNTTGSQNTVDGFNALFSNTTGNANTALGLVALLLNTTGSFNTATGAGALQSNTTGSNNTATGYQALVSNTTGNNDTASGFQSLKNNTTGASNTASGYQAMQSNSNGNGNTATGFQALQSNVASGGNTAIGYQALQIDTGGNNTASGYQALLNNTIGNGNTASGVQALQNNTTGAFNVAIGQSALQDSTTGNFNTALGEGALGVNTTGGNNIAIGSGAGGSVTSGNSNNIHIGNAGAGGDSGVIRIGAGAQTSFYAAGVRGVQTALGNAVAVMIDGNGQLGTINSSRRFKEDIQDMGDASSALMRLRPVTFRYKQPYEGGSKPIDYGLIAEEVADVFPDLVAHSASGDIETVQYQKVNAMLLNEVQKQHQQLEKQSEQLQEQSKRVQAQQEEMSALKSLLAELGQQIERLSAPK